MQGQYCSSEKTKWIISMVAKTKSKKKKKKIAKHTSEMLFSRIFEHCFKNFVLNRKLSVLAIFGFCSGFFFHSAKARGTTPLA